MPSGRAWQLLVVGVRFGADRFEVAAFVDGDRRLDVFDELGELRRFRAARGLPVTVRLTQAPAPSDRARRGGEGRVGATTDDDHLLEVDRHAVAIASDEHVPTVVTRRTLAQVRGADLPPLVVREVGPVELHAFEGALLVLDDRALLSHALDLDGREHGVAGDGHVVLVAHAALSGIRHGGRHHRDRLGADRGVVTTGRECVQPDPAAREGDEPEHTHEDHGHDGHSPDQRSVVARRPGDGDVILVIRLVLHLGHHGRLGVPEPRSIVDVGRPRRIHGGRRRCRRLRRLQGERRGRGIGRGVVRLLLRSPGHLFLGEHAGSIARVRRGEDRLPADRSPTRTRSRRRARVRSRPEGLGTDARRREGDPRAGSALGARPGEIPERLVEHVTTDRFEILSRQVDDGLVSPAARNRRDRSGANGGRGTPLVAAPVGLVTHVVVHRTTVLFVSAHHEGLQCWWKVHVTNKDAQGGQDRRRPRTIAKNKKNVKQRQKRNTRHIPVRDGRVRAR